MAKTFDKSKATNLVDLRSEKIRREISIKRLADDREREKIENMRVVDFSDTRVICGDRTNNKPPTRGDARLHHQNLNLNAVCYLVEEGGKYWHKDVGTTLAIITAARMFLASKPTESQRRAKLR